MKSYFLFYILCTVIAFADAAIRNAVMSVNGYPVTPDEYRWFMLRQRADVFQEVKTKYNLDYSNGFWDTSCGETTPKEMLIHQTTDKVVKEKIEQILFLQLGLINNINYVSFVSDLEKLNKQRTAAKEKGTVIYGPVNYSQLQYYGHWKTNLQIRAKEKLPEKEYNTRLSRMISDANIIIDRDTLEHYGGQWFADNKCLTKTAFIELKNVAGRIDHLSIDLNNNRLFVAALENNTIEVIDLNKAVQSATIRSNGRPQSALYISDFNTIAVTNGSKGQIEWYDAKTLQLAQTTDFNEGDTDNLRYNKKENLLYVAYGDGMISAVNPATYQRIADVKLSSHPESFQFDDANYIYANVPVDKYIAIIDRKNMTLLNKWPLTEIRNNYPMAFDRANNRLFVVCRKPAKLLIYDTIKENLILSFDCTGDADDIFYDDASKNIYIIGGQGFISVFSQIDPDNYQFVSNVETFPGARTGLYVPQTGLLYIAVPKRVNRDAGVLVFSAKNNL